MLSAESYPAVHSRRYPARVYTEHLHIPVGPGRVHVERTGRGGPAVVLLHGFGTSTFLWRAIAPAIAESGATAIAVDLLGFGESDRPVGGGYSPAAQAGYVERVCTALRLGQVQVAGHDLGALVALLLAARHGPRTSQVALLNPLDPAELPGPSIRAMQRASALAALGANALFGAQALLEPLLTAAVTEANRMPDRLVARYLAPFVGSEGAGDLLQLASAIVLDNDDIQVIRAVSAPVLLWQGVADGSLRTETGGATESGAAAGAATGLAARAWAERLPCARCRPLAVGRRPGLLAPEDTPDAVSAALRAWIAYPG